MYNTLFIIISLLILINFILFISVTFSIININRVIKDILSILEDIYEKDSIRYKS